MYSQTTTEISNMRAFLLKWMHFSDKRDTAGHYFVPVHRLHELSQRTTTTQTLFLLP